VLLHAFEKSGPYNLREIFLNISFGKPFGGCIFFKTLIDAASCKVKQVWALYFPFTRPQGGAFVAFET